MDPEPTSFSLDMVGAPLFVLARSRVEAANAAMRALLAHGTAAPCALEDMLGGETAAALLATLAADIPKVAPLACRLGPQGQPMILHASRLPGASERWLVTVQADIEARTRDLLARNAELEAILDWLPIGVEIMDDNFRTVMLNRHEEGLLGYTVEETEELEDWWQIAYPDPDYRALVQKSWTEGVALARASDSEMVPQEWQVCCKDGARKTIQFRYRAVGIGNHREIKRQPLGFGDIHFPFMMRLDRIDRQPDRLDVASPPFLAKPSNLAKLGGADWGEVFRMAE